MDRLWCYAGLALLCLLTLQLRRMSRSWYSPGPAFAALWSAMLLMPLAGAPDYVIWAPGVWFILALAAIFGLAALVAEQHILRRSPPRGRPVGLSTRSLRFLLLASTAAGLAAVATLTEVYGKSLSDLASLSTWVDLGARYSLARYNDDVSEPFLARIFSIGFYTGSLLGGLVWARSRRALDRMLAASPLFAALAYASLLTTRAVFMFAVAMFATTLLATQVYEGRPMVRLFQRRVVVVALAVPVTVVVVFAALQLSRGGLDDLSSLPEVLEHLRAWFLGHIPAFTNWFRDFRALGEPLRLGQRTFGGIFQIFGLAERQRGVYAEYHHLGNGQETNIYTAFRGLIEDYGISGTLVFVMLVGGVAGTAYGAAVRRNLNALPILSFVFCFIIWTPIVSFFCYNTLLVAFALFWILLRASVRRTGAETTLGA